MSGNRRSLVWALAVLIKKNATASMTVARTSGREYFLNNAIASWKISVSFISGEKMFLISFSPGFNRVSSRQSDFEHQELT